MAEQKIELRKIRDFSENLNDTFLFIRLNFKPLMKSFFGICAVFMVTHAIFSSIYQSRIGSIFMRFNKNLMGLDKGSSLRDIIDINYFLTLAFGLLTYIAMKVAFNAYIKCRLVNESHMPDVDAVWAMFRLYFFKVLLYFLLLWFIVAIFIGFLGSIAALTISGSLPTGILLILLMMIPLVYVLTAFTPFESIVILEDAGFNEAFTRCFTLMKNNFRNSFAIYFIAYLTYAIFSGIISAVTAAVFGLSSYLITENVDTSVRVATSTLNIFSYTFFIIYLVSSTLHYFTLVEKKDGTGILQRINTIGTGKSDTDQPEEQY